MKAVLKLSGKVLNQRDHRDSLAEQIRQLVQEGHQLTLVHGGGKQLSELCRKLGVEVIQIQGRRVTDEGTLEAAKMVFSAINRDLVASLLAHEIPAIGFSAFDGFFVRSHQRPPLTIRHHDKAGIEHEEIIDFGLVGEIDEIDPTLLEFLWSKGFTPVVNCLCADQQGRIMNINADTLAAEMAIALGVDRLVSISDVEGIYRNNRDPGSLIRHLDIEELQQCLDKGTFIEGMVPKVQSALQTLERGLPVFQILSGARPGALLEGFRGHGGTLLCR